MKTFLDSPQWSKEIDFAAIDISCRQDNCIDDNYRFSYFFTALTAITNSLILLYRFSWCDNGWDCDGYICDGLLLISCEPRPLPGEICDGWSISLHCVCCQIVEKRIILAQIGTGEQFFWTLCPKFGKKGAKLSKNGIKQSPANFFLLNLLENTQIRGFWKSQRGD